jgi:hypothetical protein
MKNKKELIPLKFIFIPGGFQGLLLFKFDLFMNKLIDFKYFFIEDFFQICNFLFASCPK